MHARVGDVNAHQRGCGAGRAADGAAAAIRFELPQPAPVGNGGIEARQCVVAEAKTGGDAKVTVDIGTIECVQRTLQAGIDRHEPL